MLSIYSTVVEREFDALREKMQERIEWLMELEKYPFTLNDHYLSSCRKKYLNAFKETSVSTKLSFPVYRFTMAVQVKTSDAKSKEDVQRHEQQLIVMAEVCAYFKVAYKVQRITACVASVTMLTNALEDHRRLAPHYRC